MTVQFGFWGASWLAQTHVGNNHCQFNSILWQRKGEEVFEEGRRVHRGVSIKCWHHLNMPSPSCTCCSICPLRLALVDQVSDDVRVGFQLRHALVTSLEVLVSTTSLSDLHFYCWHHFLWNSNQCWSLLSFPCPWPQPPPPPWCEYTAYSIHSAPQHTYQYGTTTKE